MYINQKYVAGTEQCNSFRWKIEDAHCNLKKKNNKENVMRKHKTYFKALNALKVNILFGSQKLQTFYSIQHIFYSQQLFPLICIILSNLAQQHTAQSV